jgi:hypothetical protein
MPGRLVWRVAGRVGRQPEFSGRNAVNALTLARSEPLNLVEHR